jgi:hypothetical protein
MKESISCKKSLRLLTLICGAAVPQQPATVREILAGTMLPGVEVATLEHSETMYSFSRVAREGPVRALPSASRQIENVHFRSGGKNYDLFDYLADNRIARVRLSERGRHSRSNSQTAGHLPIGDALVTSWHGAICYLVVGISGRDGAGRDRHWRNSA